MGQPQPSVAQAQSAGQAVVQTSGQAWQLPSMQPEGGGDAQRQTKSPQLPATKRS
jgi:hypothetical protein